MYEICHTAALPETIYATISLYLNQRHIKTSQVESFHLNSNSNSCLKINAIKMNDGKTGVCVLELSVHVFNQLHLKPLAIEIVVIKSYIGSKREDRRLQLCST